MLLPGRSEKMRENIRFLRRECEGKTASVGSAQKWGGGGVEYVHTFIPTLHSHTVFTRGSLHGDTNGWHWDLFNLSLK
jgi:hypothetical protein